MGIRGSRLTVTLVAVVATSAGALGAGLVLAPGAGAETPALRAQALAARVTALQHRAEAAAEAYDAAQAELTRVTVASVQADAAADAADGAADTATAHADDAARAAYEIGGPSVLYAGVLARGGDPDSVQSTLVAVRRVIARGNATATTAATASAAAQARAAAAAALTTRTTTLQATVSAQAAQVTAALAETKRLLAQADAQVRAQALADEAAAEAADQAAFTAALSAAGAPTTHPTGAAAGDLPDVPAPGAAAETALQAAFALSGHPYVWGGTGPVGYDCSGLVMTAYAAAGITLPRTARPQYFTGPHPTLAQLAPGDLLFWASDPADPATIEHVAIYAGNGMMVSADHTGDTVRLQPVWWNGYLGATRPTAP